MACCIASLFLALHSTFCWRNRQALLRRPIFWMVPATVVTFVTLTLVLTHESHHLQMIGMGGTKLPMCRDARVGQKSPPYEANRR